MSEKKIKPILKHQNNTLKTKKVQIEGTNNFDDKPASTANIEQEKLNSRRNKAIQQFEKISATQRVSAATKEKINLLYYFIDSPERNERNSFNGTVNLLADLYVKNNLNERQRQSFKKMYESKFDLYNSHLTN